MRRVFIFLSLGLALLTSVCFTDASFAQTDDTQTVLVAGASGRIGRHILSELTEQGYNVRGLTRNVPRARRNVRHPICMGCR